MDVTLIFPIIMVVAVIIFFMVSSRNTKGRNICNRCSGTGEVNEKWPDPDKPGGWHRVEGTCPKCKGKGRI
jgi:DnaJ-class molecular chaperone